jgi:hypothetical protein
MYKKLLLSIIAVAAFGIGAQAQEKIKTETKEHKDIKKEVRMEDKDGEKVLTIVTEENGKRTEEVYKGEEADKKLEELMSQHKEGKSKETMEVKMEEVDGKKKLTIITKKDGKESIEVYEGEEADKKLKELEEMYPEGNTPPAEKKEYRIIKKEKTTLKKESM